MPSALFEFDAVGVEPTIATTACVLLKDRLGDQGFTAIEPPESIRAVTIATSLGAAKVLTGSITSLGTR